MTSSSASFSAVPLFWKQSRSNCCWWVLLGGMLFQFKGYSPSSGKVQKLLRHNGRSKHSDVIFGNKYGVEILEILKLQLPISCWITKDTDQRGQVERLIEAAMANRHTTTNHGSQLRSRCWFYVGRKTGEPEEKPSKHGSDQYSCSRKRSRTHVSSKFWESTPGYPRWSPMQL